MKQIKSASWMVTSRWAIVMTVLPCITLLRACWTIVSLLRSRALVASSRRRIFGFLMMARAMATRCFWPPLSCDPPSPTCVSYPWGSRSMTSWMNASLHAWTMSAFDAFGLAHWMFSRMEAENSVGSCVTMPTCALHQCRLRSRTGTPSIRISPASTS
mmetsp:Transcript_70265/g.117893  ORF Transcript_70265/g.117893 Transcript_70265/m.117893 type:complete len:158 (-) Transcript_70265:1274-1747(-)